VTSMLNVALEYARRGWAIFPLAPGEKVPAIKGGRGYKDATTDETQISKWWTKYPTANIGLATGRISGVVVVDIDVKHGSGYAGIDDLGINLEKVLCARTPSGGEHLFLYAPDHPVSNRAGVRPNIDFRGDGGYVVLPPSELTGVGRYEWVDTSCYPAPYVELAPQPKPGPPPAPRAAAPLGQVSARAEVALREECEAIRQAPKGQRNDQLFRSVAALYQLEAAGELPAGELEAEVRAASAEYIADDGEREWQRTYDSARKAGQSEPREQSERFRAPAVTTSTKPTAARAPGIELFWLHGGRPRPTEWLIGGILPIDACVIIGAEEKTGKTWLALELALALACKGSVLGRWEARRQARTLLVSPEGSREGLRRRFYGLCWGQGVDPEAAGAWIPVWPDRIDLRNEHHIVAIQAAIHELTPDLLVIDPLVTATNGADENDAGAMQAVLNTIRDIQRTRPGMSVVVTHHLNKSHADRSPWHALRGSSALGAWADGLISMRRESDESLAPRRVDIWHRDEPSPEPAGFTLEFGRSPVDCVAAVRLEPCDAFRKGKGPASGKEQRHAAILEVLRGAKGAVAIDALVARAGCCAKTILRDCDELGIKHEGQWAWMNQQ